MLLFRKTSPERKKEEKNINPILKEKNRDIYLSKLIIVPKDIQIEVNDQVKEYLSKILLNRTGPIEKEDIIYFQFSKEVVPFYVVDSFPIKNGWFSSITDFKIMSNMQEGLDYISKICGIRRELSLSKIQLIPIDVGITIDDKMKNTLQLQLIKNNITFKKGDQFDFNYSKYLIKLLVIDASPTEGFVDSRTVINLLSGPYNTKFGRQYLVNYKEYEINEDIVLSDEDKILNQDIIIDNSSKRKIGIWLLKAEKYVAFEDDDQ